MKDESQEATLYINSNVLKISLKNMQNRPWAKKGQQVDNGQNTISFKYTVDYPKIELHPFDTKKFSIHYNDTSDDTTGSAIDQFTVNLQKSGKKLDLRTLSRESRDLICLTIKSFAA